MDIKILHFYPDLMSLYGSYANVSVLKRRMEQLGNTVTVTSILPGQEADLSDADFLYMGAGTEHAQKAALVDFARHGEAVKAAAESGVAMFFAGTAMELLGKTITDSDGKVYDGIGLADCAGRQAVRGGRLRPHGPVSRGGGGLYEQVLHHLRRGDTAADLPVSGLRQ